jgi:hypothetical protein
MLSRNPTPVARKTEGEKSRRWLEILAWGILVGLLTLALPLFLCMPLWTDCLFYDLGAKSLLRDGSVYRHIFYHGLPGVFWLQAAVRSLLGWGSLSLRSADLLFLASCIVLLVNGPPLRNRSRSFRVGTAIVLGLFYFGTTEWCHCQPDTWMLLPALVALYLRRRQLQDLRSPQARLGQGFLLRGLTEGVCWGSAFLIKPFVAVPALLYLLLSIGLSWKRGRAVLLDLSMVLIGGLVVGLVTVGWLMLSEDWPAFVDVGSGRWHADYLTNAPDWRKRSARALLWMLPWSGVHFLALPWAVVVIFRALMAGRRPEGLAAEQAAQALLAACYLGWFAQANFLQMQFPYHLVVPLLLALAFLAGQSWKRFPAWVQGTLVAAFLIWAAVPHPQFTYHETWVTQGHPLLQRSRLAQWGRCWREGSSPQVRDQLTLERQFVAPSWVDLQRIAAELRRLGVRDRELTCYSLSTLSLYLDLGVEPATRFVMLTACLAFFPAHRDEIYAEVASSPQRYVVSDLQDLGFSPKQARLSVRLGPNLAKIYPWSQPVVFRSGRYLIHRVNRPEGPVPPTVEKVQHPPSPSPHTQ